MTITDFCDSIPIGVCAIRRDRRTFDILYANTALAHMLAAPEAEEKAELQPDGLVGQRLEDVWPAQDIRKLLEKLRAPVPPRDCTLAVHDAQGEYGARWATLSITEDTVDGQPCFVLWATDISLRKEAEARLQQAVAAADEAAAVKASFLATMSHEIRTPMQAVYGLLELIAEENPSPQIMAMVDTARRSASGLLEILDDILDFAKMDAHKMQLDTFEVPVRTLVYGINEALAVKVHGKAVELRDDIGKAVPFVIIGDPKRLRQILMNLTDNALKFTSEGSVTIRVTTQIRHIPQPRHGVALRFEVSDTGIGLDATACARLFQPFSQADNSTARKYGGTGLGLSICKALVELMGGQIGVESEKGAGATFWFEIPTEEVGTDATTVPLPALDGLTVLSVEDHPQGAREIVRSLESMGAQVESCGSCKEALALIRRRPFDVAVIDQGLPDGLGLDLIRNMMDIRPFMGLIMYTVRDDIGLQHSLNALGVQYLSKPASRLGLGAAVQDAARRVVRRGIAGPTRLLIAEDTDSVREVLARQLARLGVGADFVGNGIEALAALDTGRYGILFTDLHMPDMDGFDLVSAIRACEAGKGPDADPFPVIVLTADVQMAQRQVYLEHGFDECLLKPVSLGQFRRLLIRWGLLEETEAAEEDGQDGPENVPATLPPAIDLKAMKAQMGAVDADSIAMMQMFVEMTAPLLGRLETAWAARDFHDLREAAHSLKGAARSACCPVLGDIGAQLQDEADRKNEAACAPLVPAACAEFGRVGEAVATLAERGPP